MSNERKIKCQNIASARLINTKPFSHNECLNIMQEMNDFAMLCSCCIVNSHTHTKHPTRSHISQLFSGNQLKLKIQ